MKRIFHITLNAFYYAFLVCMIAFIVMLASGIRPYITMSGSMEPSIQTGSVCLVNTKAAYSEVQEGDIIAFRTATGGLVTHRVIAISDSGFETKGDANDVSDGISTNAINFHGKTLFSVPYVGYIVKYLQQPAVLAILGVILLMTFAVHRIISDEARKKAQALVPIPEDEQQSV